MKPRILLIDDMSSMLLGMERDLSGGPWILDRADSFLAAHRRLLEQPPHLILCDFQLDPGKTVEDVIELTRKCFYNQELRFSGLPFIALSASDEQLQTLEGNHNVMAKQSKPFGGADLLNAVQAALQSLAGFNWLQSYPVPMPDSPRPEAPATTFSDTSAPAGFSAPPSEPATPEPIVPPPTSAKPPLEASAPEGNTARLEALDAGELVEPAAGEAADPPEAAELDGSPSAGSLAPPEEDIEPTETEAPGGPAIVLREPISTARVEVQSAFAAENGGRDLAVTSEILDDPAVRAAVGAAVERLTGGEALLRAPTGLVNLAAVIAWAMGDGRSLAIRFLCATEIVAVFVRAGKIVGVASDAWPNDTRAEALRGRVLPPLGTSDGSDTSGAQLEALKRGCAGNGWVEVHEQLPPRWAAVQDEMVRGSLNAASMPK